MEISNTERIKKLLQRGLDIAEIMSLIRWQNTILIEERKNEVKK